jgi:quercetin dioxygenase-like cupin family protein
MRSVTVKNVNDFTAEPVAAGIKTSIQVLIASTDAPNFAMRRFIMEPGGEMPAHTNAVEHEQFVLKGHASIGIGNETHEVKAGDVLFIPPGVPHWYRNSGDENYEFLCMVPNQKDEITIIGKGC